MQFLRAILAGLFAVLLPGSTVDAALVTQRQSSTVCGPGKVGIAEPANNAKIVQIKDGNFSPTNVTIVYCSGQYFKTRTIDASALLTSPGATSGELLVKDVKPDNQDAPAGYYSYRFNATIYPEDGNYLTGKRTLTIYETTTGENLTSMRRERLAHSSLTSVGFLPGYYNPMNYELWSINITLKARNSS